MREFLFYLANGSYGWELDGQITRQMAVYIHDAMALFGTIKRCNRNLEKDVREQVLIWPRYNLTQELNLTKHLAVSKLLAHSGDVSLILRETISPLGLRQVLSMCVLLNMANFSILKTT